MRILLPILLLAALGAGYFLLRREPATSGPGLTAPGVATTESARPAAELARAEPGNEARVAVEPAATVKSDMLSQLPAKIAAENALTPAVPEPSLQGGSTDQPVGAAVSNEMDEALKLKYLNSSRPERLQALQALRTILENQRSSPDKDIQQNLPALKFEMGWLESNLDG
jgi:hypothetical protein